MNRISMLSARAFPVRNAFWSFCLVLLAVTVGVYWRGLHGVFLFDDFANLPALGAYGPVDNWTAFWRYITSGHADPTGRPLALLSFLIDAHNWPADPFPFKRDSLILHLVNGLLLAVLLRRLGRIAYPDSETRTDIAAALGAGLWMLHPLFVSTTLYVVQREAMLPATFVLLGLLGYLVGRTRVARGRSGIWICASSIIVCTGLGVASKANGILLPLLTWLVEALLLAPTQPIPASRQRQFTWMRRLVLVLPTGVLLIWLTSRGIGSFVHGTGWARPWTLGERLLTEARIVSEYLGLLWLPHPYTTGLFNDAIQVSHGLLSPPTTLAAIIFLGALLTAAIALRRRMPIVSLAILFYFAGHLLESTVIPLELYYEHRNYLPAMLMFWPLAMWLTGDGVALHLRRALAIIVPLMLAGMTFMRADLWGNAQQQALLWAALNPDSPRAQAYASATDRARGRPDQAAARMNRTHVTESEDIQIALNLVGAQCKMGRVTPAALARAMAALRSSRTAGRLYFNWMASAIQRVQTHSACQGLEAPQIQALLDAMAQNPRMKRFRGWRQDNMSLRAKLAIALGDPKAALRWFDRALAASPRPGAALDQAAMLGAAGYPAEGIAHLDYYETLPKPAFHWHWNMASVHAWLLRDEGFMPHEIAHLRGVLEDDLRNADKPGNPPSHDSSTPQGDSGLRP